jgi:hypothetical protein
MKPLVNNYKLQKKIIIIIIIIIIIHNIPSNQTV